MNANTNMTPAPGMRDSLTKLFDRHAFLISLRRDCLHTATSGGMMALLVINVDQFRRINSVFGLKAGDAVLVRLGEILQGLGRRQDRVARIGSDEFALILSGIMNEGHAVLAANKLLRQLEEPQQLEAGRIPVSVTVGVALSPNHGTHPESLLKHAEFALLKARRAGTHYLVAEEVETADVSDTWDLEIELESALDNNEMELYYQPQVDLRTHTSQRAEALIRWNSPSRGLLLPRVFIPLAEQTGHIHKLTQWILNTALRHTAECRELTGRDVQVSVNMPASAFQYERLVDIVRETERLWGAKEKMLTLEITESMAMADPETAFEILKALRDAGARISIDDFGTGYSSLSYFRDIPADELKIDRSFIEDLARSAASRDLASVITDLGHRFGMEVVAEGVESDEVMRKLSELNCDLIQGRYVAPPMPFEVYQKWLTQNISRSERKVI